MTAMLEAPERAVAPERTVAADREPAPASRSSTLTVDRPPAPATPCQRRRPRSILTPNAGRLALLLTVVGYLAATAVEPAPTGPQPVLPFWANALGYATLVVLLASWAALAGGRRSGLWLGAIAGGGLVGQVALCPALEHHLIAGWWWAQLAVFAGITALNVALLARTRPAA